MDFDRIANNIVLAFDGWEPPTNDRRSWRKKLPDGTYVYRYTNPNHDSDAHAEHVFGRKSHFAIKRRENEIYADKIEHLVAYNDDGEKVLDIAGDESSVSLEGITDKIAGTWVTHNHPGSTSFSWPDIFNMFRFKAKGMRITSPKFDYQMLFNQDVTIEFIEEIYKRINLTTMENFWKKINDNEITLQEANGIHHHVVWTLVSKELGFKYERTEHK